jgi:hypothetical protein
LLIEVKVKLQERFLFLLLVGFVSSGSYSYPRFRFFLAERNLINAIGGRGTWARPI